MATRNRVVRSARKHARRNARSPAQADLKNNMEPVSKNQTEKILLLSLELGGIRKRILCGRDILQKHSDPMTRLQIRLALEHFAGEKSRLLSESQVTYEKVLSVIQSSIKMEGPSPQLREVEENKLAGLRLVEASLDPGNRDSGFMHTDILQVRNPGIKRLSASIEHLSMLAHEFIETTPGLLECPRRGAKNTRYQEYSVILDSECVGCGDCNYLWRLPFTVDYSVISV